MLVSGGERKNCPLTFELLEVQLELLVLDFELFELEVTFICGHFIEFLTGIPER